MTTLPQSDLADLDQLFPLATEAADSDGVAGAAAVAPAVLLDPANPALRTRGILRRRSAPVIGFVGLNGQGKTYAAVRDALLSLAIGRRVLSTVTILDPESGNPHPNFERFTSWSQFHDLRDTDVLLDEVTGIADARDAGMPKHVRRMIAQQRRQNNRVAWTGIDFDNCDKRIRQVSQAIVRCKGHLPIRPAMRPSGQLDAVSMWAPNRMFVLTTFDGQTLKSADDSAQLTEEPKRQRRARVLNREFVWGPGSLAFRCYNTLDSVSGVDNSCPQCGLRVPERLCKGHG